MAWLGERRVAVQIWLGLAGLLLAAIIFVVNIFISLPKPEEVGNIRIVQSTKIYDRTGEVLLAEIYGEQKRTVVPPDQIPDVLRWATISIEDDAFYSHPAFDWKGILRAIAVNLIRGQVVQGGSTITQQLAKNAFLSPEKTISRKIKELILASRLEKRYSKDEILNLYLNQVPYGSNYYGVEAASRAYFNKAAKDLTLNEAAVLAALPRSPNYYSPWGSHRQELEDRKNFILKRMKELGYIDNEQYLAAIKEMPKFAPAPEQGLKAPHFSLLVQDYLTEKYGEESLRSEGLKVITTLDWRLQQAAEEAVKRGAERNNRLYGGANAALMALDPETGQILALVGSKDYFADPEPQGCQEGKTCKFEGKFNVATQGLRQPGSALKPFAYLTAFQKGLTPETIVWDTPTEFNPDCPAIVDFSNRDLRCYHPRNFDLVFRGPVKLKEGLAQSINIPSVKVLYIAGLRETIATLKDFGITTLSNPDRYGLSLVLGGGEIKLAELARAYSVLAADGIYHQSTAILKIENIKGEVLEEYQNSGRQVVDPQYVRLINNILSDINLRAPLFKASLEQTEVPGYEVALKTGTTNDYADAWAFGYTPNLVVGVWAGNNNRASLKSQGSSILAAVPIWHDFMTRALPTRPAASFPLPLPTSSTNPILRGELVKDGFHDLLYYLNRINDPQFSHWETGVRVWLATNSVDLSRFALAEPQGGYSFGETRGEGVVEVNLASPQNGAFVGDDIPLLFEVRATNPISKIEVYFNGLLVDSQVGNFGHQFTYQKTIRPAQPSLQNLLVVRAVDDQGIRGEKQIIVFR
jgi:1A family penicillin-binding protein